MNYSNKIIMIAAVTGILTLSIVALASFSANQVYAQFADCQTTLSLTSNPRTGTVSSGSTLPVSLLGELKCGDSGIAGATVIISGIDDKSNSVITSDYGKYSLEARLAPAVYTLQAYFAGDSEHGSASASRTLTVNESPQG